MATDTERYFSWLKCVDVVSETLRVSWDTVFQKNIYEFFNILAYRNDKDEKLRKQLEKWKKK